MPAIRWSVTPNRSRPRSPSSTTAPPTARADLRARALAGGAGDRRRRQPRVRAREQPRDPRHAAASTCCCSTPTRWSPPGAHPDAGARPGRRTRTRRSAGPRLMNERGFPELSFGWADRAARNELKQKMLSAALSPERALGTCGRSTSESRQAGEVAWVSGACMVIRRAGSRSGRPARRALFHVHRGRRSLHGDAPAWPHDPLRGRAPKSCTCRGRSAATQPRDRAPAAHRASSPTTSKHLPRWVAAASRLYLKLTGKPAPTDAMRIAIDARKLRDFGIGTYIRNILIELSRLDQQTEYVVLCRPDDVGVAASAGPNFRMVPETAPHLLDRRADPDSARAGARARAPGARAALRAAAGDPLPLGRDHSRLHSPDVPAVPAEPAGLRLCQGVDVERGAEGRSHPDGVGGVEARHPAVLRRPAREGVRSSTTRSTSGFSARPTTERMDLVRQRYQLDHPFVLYVGNIKPHKNIERLIDAFGARAAPGLEDLKLVIIGDELSKYPALRQAVHRHKLDKHVRFLGFQPHETLAAFYRLARAFVFPSLYEGFGLPPLEAMACGTPVVTSNVSSLPEVAGGAALLVDPHRYRRDCRRHPPRGHRRGRARRPDRRGLARARQFSWAQSVGEDSPHLHGGGGKIGLAALVRLGPSGARRSRSLRSLLGLGAHAPREVSARS